MTLQLLAVALIVLVGYVAAECRIVAIGDIHGDLENAQRLLRAGKIIDRSDAWIAGCTTLIQTGDIVDRGIKSLETIDFFRALQSEASRFGGEVIMLLGNHELMNFAGDVRYVNPTEINRVGGEAAWKRLFATGGKYRSWMEELDAVAMVNHTVFVHAGVLPSFAGLGVAGMNRMLRVQLKRNRFNYGLLGDDGPLWTRKVITKSMAGECQLIDMSLELLGAKRMVVGHTIQQDFKVHSYCEGKLIAIDVAISRAISGVRPACVEFFSDSVTPIYV